MVSQKAIYICSDVARANKVHADLFTLRQAAKSKLRAGRQKKSKTAAFCVAEWNVRTMLDRTTSQRPERQTAPMVLEMNRYNLNIAALS